MIIREYYRKNIKTPGMSVSIVVDENGRRLRPSEEVRSKSGAHGEDVYDIVMPVYILRYNVSNSGKVSWSVTYVNPSNQQISKVQFKDLPLKVMKKLVKECEKEGIELNLWEEKEIIDYSVF